MNPSIKASPNPSQGGAYEESDCLNYVESIEKYKKKVFEIRLE
jgi:hypothetical protein